MKNIKKLHCTKYKLCRLYKKKIKKKNLELKHSVTYFKNENISKKYSS